MNKKLISSVLLVCMVVFVLGSAVGCSSKTETKSESKIEYPTKPIQFIVPWSPGGGSDTTMRIVAKHLEKVTGQSVPVVNKPGVSGTIGLKELTQKPAEGYYIGMIHEGLLVAHHTGVTELNYDNFIPIASMTDSPQYLAVRGDAPYNTLEEFKEYTKSHPGELKYGTTLKALPHAWGAILANKFETEFKYIAYEGTSKRIQALAGGFIDAGIVDYPSSIQFVESGKLKLLASFTEERLENTPDVPTMRELGYDLLYSVKRGIVVPQDTPAEIVEILSNALETVAKSEEFKKELEQAGSSVDFKSTEDYQKYLEKINSEIKEVSSQL